MRAWPWLHDQDVKVTAAIIAVVVVPAVLTLNTVRLPIEPSDVTLNPTPLGYTVSLLIYLVPVLAVYWWFSRRFREAPGVIRRSVDAVFRRRTARPASRERQLDYRRGAYRRTLATLIPLGFLLDIVFGLAFLTFTNKQANLGILFPAFSFSEWRFRQHIPVEEFVFYALGFIAILSVYIWCDEYWLKLYNVPDYDLPPDSAGGGLPPFIAQVQLRTPLIVSTALIGAGWAYKKFGPHEFHDGFPSYFTFLVLASLFPSILLLRVTQRFINWRAVSVAVFWVVLTSLLWEATLASPYGWWGYQPRHMVGLFVGAWFRLPIEAGLLWLSVTFTTVMVYETFKILLSMQRVCNVGWREAMFGPNFRWWLNESFRPSGQSALKAASRPRVTSRG